MASTTGAAAAAADGGGGAARFEEKRATATRSDEPSPRAFDADADESETALLSTSGALSPRAVPPPDEIVGPPRRPFRRRGGAHQSPSSHHRARGDPSESGGFGGRRREGGNGLFSSSSSVANNSSSSSLGTKVLKLFLANWDRALVLAALIAATVLVSTRGVQFLKDALAWLQRHSGWAGWGIFTASYAAAVSLLLPGVAAVLGAGFVFGFWRGLLAVWVGGAAGQVGAFLLSRYLLGHSVSGLLGGSRLWASVDAAMEAEGWKLLLLLRLSPVIPYNLLNLAAAATSVGLLPFALASAVGIVPECALLVYAGSLAESITAVVSGTATKKHRKVTWILGGLTIAAGVAAGVAATLLVRRAVRRAAARADALAEEEEEAAMLRDGGLGGGGGFLLSLDHETFDRNSFGGGAGEGGNGSWLSPPSPPLNGENRNGGGGSGAPPLQKPSGGANGTSSSLIDV